MTTELDRALHTSVLKREAWKEREWREKKKQEDESLQLGFGATEMSKAELRKIIDGDRRMYYRTEELNDKLYIHYKGWRKLQNLEGWTGLRALYAECNAFDQIQGLQQCRSLRSLFLQENCIRKIEGLENCPDLWNINLSNNFIERIEGLSHLRKLNTLTIAKNKIGMRGVEDLLELVDTALSSLDVQDNQIWDPDVLPEVLMRMPELRVLYLKGNPCTKKITNYRKNITVCCEDLRYLDDRPVFAEDRRAADAFNRGGLEEERAERRRIREENNAKHDRNMKAFSEMIERAKSEKREREAMRAEDKFTDETDPVESQEKRMQRQVEQWRKEHADEIKDDAREHAEKCLRQERGHEANGAEPAAEQAAGAEPAAKPAAEPTEEPAAVPAAGQAAEAGQEAAEPEAAAEDGPKPDTRKLVYEDIWDSVPSPAAAREEPRATGAAGAAPSGARAQVAGAAAADVFLPWATGPGVAGMESVPVTTAAVERRAAALLAAAGQQQGSEAAAEAGACDRPAWYSKYAERAQPQCKQATPLTAAPTLPPARPAEANALPGSELDEMD